MEAVEEVEESKDAEGEAKDEEKTGEPVEGEVTYGELLEGGGVIGMVRVQQKQASFINMKKKSIMKYGT